MDDRLTWLGCSWGQLVQNIQQSNKNCMLFSFLVSHLFCMQEAEECHPSVSTRSLYLCLPSSPALPDDCVHMETSHQGKEEAQEEGSEEAPETHGKETSRWEESKSRS